MDETMIRMLDWAPAVDPIGEGDWGTTHLPTSVVKNPFLLYIDARTDENDPRIGGCWFSLNFNGRINEPLSKEEKEYILLHIGKALDGLPGEPQPDA